MSYFDLTGQVAVVTGAATGIGEAIARRFAQSGAVVVVADLNLEGATAVAQSIGGKAFAVAVDVTNSADCERAVKEVIAKAGRLDILVNNAAIIHHQLIEKKPFYEKELAAQGQIEIGDSSDEEMVY